MSLSAIHEQPPAAQDPPFFPLFSSRLHDRMESAKMTATQNRNSIPKTPCSHWKLPGGISSADGELRPPAWMRVPPRSVGFPTRRQSKSHYWKRLRVCSSLFLPRTSSYFVLFSYDLNPE
mmetsp:Transcript_10833/g.21769  ORF Transcript_10833/g.21769 Transcript_10833/m.21769 type:complete len:120 (-) Transcript_10833:193-552(-)